MMFRVSLFAVPVALAAALVLVLLPLVPAGGVADDAQGERTLRTSLGSFDLAPGIALARRAISIPFFTSAAGFDTLDRRANSRQVDVTGHLACTEGGTFRVDVTITQASAGAEGEGHTQDKCTGETQTWTVLVVARGPAEFAPGPALVQGVAKTPQGGKLNDTFEWERERVLE